MSFQMIRYCSNATSKLAKPDINKLVKKSKVVVFMKGVPDEPRCGFSNAVVQILKMHGVKYDAYNVLENDNLRNGTLLYFYFLLNSMKQNFQIFFLVFYKLIAILTLKVNCNILVFN